MKSLLLFLALSWSMTFAQDAKPSDPTFRLGMTRDEVHAAFGPPKQLWVPQASRHYSLEEYGSVAAVYGNVADVYFRKTPRNEFEVQVAYGVDDSSSRLHPIFRTVAITFVVDRPGPLDAILPDLPEAGALCSAGCTLLAVPSGLHQGIVAYPPAQTSEQLALAAGAASGWRASSSGQSPGRWLVGLRLQWEGIRYESKPQPAQREQRIEEITLSVVNPEFDASVPWFAGRKPVGLGAWKPGP